MNDPERNHAQTHPTARPKPQLDAQSVVIVWTALRKYWAAAVVAATLVVLGVAFYTLSQTKIYRATATIQLDPSPPKPLGKDVQTVVEMGAGDWFANHQYLETQYKIILSKRVAQAVVERLGLHRDPSFILNVPERASLTGSTTPERATDLLRSRLTVEPVKDSRLTYIRYEDASPERAQRILATVIDVYIAQNLDDTLLSVNSAVDWLRSQLDKLKSDLDTSEMALHEFKEQQNVLALEVDDQSNTLRDQLRQLSTTLTTARTKRNELAAKRSELLKVNPNDPQNLSAPELLSSSLLTSLRQHYEDAIRERDEQTGRNKGKNHVDVRSAEAAVAAARAAVLAEVRNIQGAAERELAAAEKNEGGIAALLVDAQRRAVEVNLLEIQYNRLRRTRENNDKLYSMVLERTKETDLQRLLRVNNIRVVDAPDQPNDPVRPRPVLMAFLAVILGLSAATVVAIGLTAADRTIKTPEDIETELGVTCLGLLPALNRGSNQGYGYSRTRKRQRAAKMLSKPELVVHEQPTSNIAEAARAIRTNLMFMSTDKPIRALLVTSASPSEGKTTVACCIAIAIAHAGHRTLLVDCDLRRPRIHQIFGMPGDRGLTTALLEKTPLEDLILKTEIPNLSVLPAGLMPPNPADLMHSESFRAIVEELRSRYDRVVFDSSPVALVTDATILSAYVDATMLVVRAFVTRKDSIRHALRSILDIGSATAGIVLNAVDFSRHEYKYATYYGRYGYGEPYGERVAGESGSAPRSKDGDDPHQDAPAA